MGAPQFAQQVDNTTTEQAVFTESEITANTANQYDGDILTEDVSSSVYETGEQNISGAGELVVALTENSGNAVNATIEWTDGTGTVQFAENPEALQNLSNAADYAIIAVKSTHVNIKLDGSSTDTDGTVNAH